MRTIHRRTLLQTLGALALAATASRQAAAAAGKIKPDARSALIVVDVQNCFVTGGTLP